MKNVNHLELQNRVDRGKSVFTFINRIWGIIKRDCEFICDTNFDFTDFIERF